MKRWVVELEAGGETTRRVVRADTGKRAQGDDRVREWLAAHTGGRVARAYRVIPGVVWREPWGYYLCCRRQGRRYNEALETQDPEVAADRAAVKVAAIDAEKWGALAETRTRRTAATIEEVIGAYRAVARQNGAPRECTVYENTYSLRRVCEVAGIPLSAGSERLSGQAVRVFVERWLARAEERGTAPERVRRTIHALVTHARSALSPRWQEAYADAGLVVPREAWDEFRRRPIPEARPVRWERPAPEMLARLQEAARGLRERALGAGGEVARGLWTSWILSRCLGLRAAEQAALRWGWFEEHAGRPVVVVRERETEGFRPKGAAGAVPVGVEAWADLVALRGSAGAADYVLPGGKPWARYRVVMGLARWARAEGYVGRQHVAHDLRAISADEIADDQEWGPYVADRWLRHAPRSVGDRHYRELRLPATFAGVGLWGLRAG